MTAIALPERPRVLPHWTLEADGGPGHWYCHSPRHNHWFDTDTDPLVLVEEFVDHNPEYRGRGVTLTWWAGYTGQTKLKQVRVEPDGTVRTNCGN